MTLVTVAEDSSLSDADWQIRLSIGVYELEQMLSAGILRPKAEGLLALEFVGLVVFPNSCLHALPKYVGPDGLDLRATLAILRGYFSRSAKRSAIRDELRSPEFSNAHVLREFDALLALRSWFAQHGLYRTEVQQRATTGRPNWVRTLARRAPLITGDSVLYPVVESERRYAEFNEITAIQVGLLTALSRRHGFRIDGELLAAEVPLGSAFDTWPLTPDMQQHFQRRVQAEKRAVFESNNLRLLSLLEELLTTRLAGQSGRSEIFGTTAFYSVWEDGCRVLLEGMATPAESIGHAAWTYETTAGLVVEEARQLPDIAIVKGDKLYIVDAKYYHPFPSSKPGAPDIIKQIYYAEAVTSTTWSAVRSIFIFPVPGASKLRRLGNAAIHRSARKFPTVEAWGLDPSLVFASYPQRAVSSAGGARLLQELDSL